MRSGGSHGHSLVAAHPDVLLVEDRRSQGAKSAPIGTGNREVEIVAKREMETGPNAGSYRGMPKSPVDRGERVGRPDGAVNRIEHLWA
jgi:hypothetical protein